MASVSNRPDGTRRVGFTGPDRRRRTLYLGRVPKRAAEEVRGLVERLNAAALTGAAPADADARKVAALDDVMHGKLAAAGLTPARDSAAVGAFVAAYVRGREPHVKPLTLRHLRDAERHLLAFFGPGKALRDVTPGDADDFRGFLAAGGKRGRGPNTVNRWMGRAKEFFAAAARRELIDRNPFDGQRSTVRANPGRAFFLTAGDAARVLDACPDARWRLIFALARWGGVRVPSELTPLTWGDVDWERGRLTVTSPKTAHHEGKGSRTIPLFPELRPHLEAAFDLAEPGTVAVLPGVGSATNLRTGMLKIVKRAGLKPWPKLFHNLRATRQTELAAEHPIHVVCDWIGNTAAVAAEHYLTTTDADFDRAAGINAAATPENNRAGGAEYTPPAGRQRRMQRARNAESNAAGGGEKRQAAAVAAGNASGEGRDAASRRRAPASAGPPFAQERTRTSTGY